MSNEKNRKVGWVFVGDEILPSYIGHYFINHEIRIPSLTIQDSIESRRVFFVAQVLVEPTHLKKNMLVKLDQFFGSFSARFRVKTKKNFETTT